MGSHHGDLFITRDRAISYIIVDVGGFLGIGAKLVDVPASDFRIINDKAVLPGTEAMLKQLPAFHFSQL